MNAYLGRTLVVSACLTLGGCSFPVPDSSPAESASRFSGPTFADGADPAGDGPVPVAVHGTETLTLLAGAEGPPFAGSFTATGAAPSVLSIDSLLPPQVVVRGMSAGDANVQLFPIDGTSALADVTVPVASLSAAAFVPREFANASFIVPLVNPQPWALLAGTSDSLMVVQLEDTSMRRLVDEGTTVTATSAAAAQKAWDLYAVTTSAHPGQASFAIHAGGASFASTVPVVAGIDDIAVTALQGLTVVSAPSTIPVHESVYLCLAAQSGGAAVAGATWTFSLSANLALEHEVGFDFAPSCLVIRGTADGAGTLTATASGFTKSFSLTVDTSQ